MPLIPPDPLKILTSLREQLEALRQLSAADPIEPAYAKTAEYVNQAVVLLESVVSKSTRIP